MEKGLPPSKPPGKHPAAHLLVPMIGLTVFAAEKGHASCVTFSLTSTPDAPTEKFYCWIHLCDWRMRSAGQELAHSESDDHTIKAAAAALNGRKLEAMELKTWVTSEGIFHGAMLRFGANFTMNLQQYEGKYNKPDSSIFTVRDAENTWISYRSDGNVVSESSSADAMSA